MNIISVIEWKFPGIQNVVTRDDIITEYPGDIPSQEDLDAWTAEYETRLAIINQIEALESTATPRRIREALIDPAWIKDLDAKIAALRAKL